jgi:HAD superfamily hydrolase (TIGR01509 family)
MEHFQQSGGRWGVLFDMDGVIFDSESVSVQCWRRAAQELGLADIDAVYTRCVGTNVAASTAILTDAYGARVDPAAFLNLTNRFYNDWCAEHGLPVKPGAPEILRALRAAGIPMAIASSTARAYVTRELSEAGLLPFFDAVICGDMVTRSKPDPEIFLKAADALGLRPAESIVIEDSYNGIRAAAAGGMHPVMVPDILPPTDEMRRLAEQILPSLFAVRDWLLPTDR